MMMKILTRQNLRWVGIFLFCATTPQFVFRFAGKVLRPVVDVAEDMVAAVEQAGAE